MDDLIFLDHLTCPDCGWEMLSGRSMKADQWLYWYFECTQCGYQGSLTNIIKMALHSVFGDLSTNKETSGHIIFFVKDSQTTKVDLIYFLDSNYSGSIGAVITGNDVSPQVAMILKYLQDHLGSRVVKNVSITLDSSVTPHKVSCPFCNKIDYASNQNGSLTCSCKSYNVIASRLFVAALRESGFEVSNVKPETWLVTGYSMVTRHFLFFPYEERVAHKFLISYRLKKISSKDEYRLAIVVDPPITPAVIKIANKLGVIIVERKES
jgi:transcription elongation factor Elf1